MSIKFHGRALVAVFLAASGFLSAQTGSPPPQNLVPAGAIAYIQVEDPASFGPYFLGTAPLFQEEVFQDAFKAVGMDPREGASDFEKEMGFPLADLIDVLKGPAALAAFGDVESRDTEAPRILIVARVGPEEKVGSLWDQLRGRITSELEAAGGEVSRETVMGSEVWVFEVPGRPRTWMHLGRGQLVLSNERGRLESVLARLDGKEVASISGDPDLDVARKRLPTDPGVWGYFDAGAFLRAEAREDRVNAFGMGSTRKVWFGAGGSGRRLELACYLHAPGERRGILKLLESGVQQGVKAGALASPDAVSYSYISKSPGAFVDGILDLVARAFPQEDVVMQYEVFQERFRQDLDVDIQDDLLDLLGAPIVSVALPPKEEGGRPLGFTYLPVKDGSRVVESVKKLLPFFGMMLGLQPTPETKEYLGYEITSFELPLGMPGMGGAGANLKLGFCVAEGQLFFATDMDSLKQALRLVGKEKANVTTTPEYIRAVQGLPRNPLYFQFVKVGPVLKAGFSQFKATFSRMGTEVGEVMEVLDAIDPDDLADLGESIAMAVAVDSEGVRVHMNLVAGQEKAAPKKGGDGDRGR